MSADGRARDLLVHIGYHKTGTTWLQLGLFRNEEAGLCAPWTVPELRDQLVVVDGLDFDPQAAWDYFRPNLEAARARGSRPVLTWERLSGNPHSGGYDSKVLADRLAATFPGARVLIVIREQRAMLLSVYKQYVKIGGAATLERYVEPTERIRVPLFNFRFFAYHRLIRYYREVFGAERVLALPYERLRRDVGGFVRQITDFVGARYPETTLDLRPRNVALDGAAITLKRHLNFWFGRHSVNPSAPLRLQNLERTSARLARRLPQSLRKRSEARLRARAERLVGDRYRESNRLSAELLGVDLAAYGYDV